MTQKQWMLKSKIGALYLVASEKGARGLFWKEQMIPLAQSLDDLDPASRILKKVVDQLNEYLGGKRRDFDLPIDVHGTQFQEKVWKRLTEIPYGETLSYREIARQIKNPNAACAVGTANGKNPLCIIIPCHRVITADGSLGGYSGGLDVKARLLKIERHFTAL